MFECDARLSADGVPFLLHDHTLERTTNGHGLAGLLDWAQLQTLDAGGWHSPAHRGEPLASLQALSQWCRAQGHALNIEIKPTPGTEARTGAQVAQDAARWWAGAPVAPLLSSFSEAALQAAQGVAPHLPRALLLERLRGQWLARAQALQAVAVIAQHGQWQADAVRQARAAGLRCLSYTVNEAADVARLRALGIDGLITDRVDRFRPERSAT